MNNDYHEILARIRALELEHFQEPCHPQRCSHTLKNEEPA